MMVDVQGADEEGDRTMIARMEGRYDTDGGNEESSTIRPGDDNLQTRMCTKSHVGKG